MIALDVGMDRPDGAVVLGAFSIAIAGLVGWRLVRLVGTSDHAYNEIAAREIAVPGVPRPRERGDHGQQRARALRVRQPVRRATPRTQT